MDSSFATTRTQTTLAQSIDCTGIGLHGGRPVRARLVPATADSGIVFRVPASGSGRLTVDVPANVAAVGAVDHATSLGVETDAGRIVVQTVEHLLAALGGLGIDNCLVELDAPEVPILDGSSAPWVYLVREAGLRSLAAPKRWRRIVRPFSVEVGGASVSVHPADCLRVTCGIDFRHPMIGEQEVSLTVTPRSFAESLAPARTFGFLRDVEALRRSGLIKGGSYANAVVLDEHEVLNGRLRFPDEFVRHKALDLIGDLALTGPPLLGHVVARRAGHRLHVEFGRRLLAESSCWRLETRTEPAPAGLSVAAMGAGASAPFGLATARAFARD